MNQALSTIIILIKLDYVVNDLVCDEHPMGRACTGAGWKRFGCKCEGPQKFGIALVRHFAQLKKMSLLLRFSHSRSYPT